MSGLLGDTAARDYALKLERFNAHAQPELRQAIASLEFTPGMRVVDVGCGSGEALGLLQAALPDDATLLGFDLASAHVDAARRRAAPSILVAQANLLQLPLARSSVDLIWCVNTINHVHDATTALRQLATLLRDGGCIALGQSALLPEMYFAWDARLERMVTQAVHQYYRDRYQVDERTLTAVRALVGSLRAAGLQRVKVRTFTIERITPLNQVDEAYLYEAVFRETWGERLRPYLSPEDFQQLSRLTDPHHPEFALRRPDFHYLQTFTLATGGL